MTQFFFVAKSIDGVEKKGVSEAEDENQLAHTLHQEGFVLVKAVPAEGRKRRLALPTVSLGVSLKDKIFFIKNLQVMAAAGLSLPRAIGILADQTENRIFRKALNNAKDSIIRGENFSAALERYPAIFSDFLRSMIRVGEETGTLENVLSISVAQMEKDYNLRAKVKGAMVYPSVILVAMMGIGMLMLATVVPQLAATFEDLHAELPMSTQFVIAAGKFVQSYWWLVLIVIIAITGAIMRILKTKWGKKAADDAALKFPALNTIVRNVNTAYTLRNLSALIGAGISLPRALEITAGTVSNVNYALALNDIKERVKKGDKFSAAIKDYSKIYPATAVQMIAVGEETGETSNILLKLADFYETEVDEETKNFASIIEPMLMIVIGIVVGFFAMSMMQPMYSMLDSV